MLACLSSKVLPWPSMEITICYVFYRKKLYKDKGNACFSLSFSLDVCYDRHVNDWFFM